MADPSRPAGGGRAPRAVVAVALFVAVLAVYAPVRHHDFVRFDDFEYIVDNPRVLDGLSVSGVRWAFGSFAESNWHPLTWLSHMLDVELFGTNPAGHHLASVVLHGLAACLLFQALALMTGSTWSSALVAALFALHPLRVESVAWAAERKDVLSGALWMATLVAWALYVRRPSAARYAAVAACLALGLLAKPIGVTLPVVLMVLDVWPLSRWSPLRDGLRGAARNGLEKLPLLALAGASAVVTVLAQRGGGAVETLEALPLAERSANAVTTAATYLVQAVWPAGLAFFYPHPALVAAEPFRAVFVPAALSAAALVAITLGVAAQASRRPWLTAGWAWYAITLVPVIGLVQVGNQAHADRYTYIPLVGIALALAWTARELAGRRPRLRPWIVAAALAALAALAGLTHHQLDTWRTSRTLFERALAVTERNWVAYNNLGNLELREGRLAEAVDDFRRALDIRPNLTEAHNNLGAALERMGDHAGAVARFRDVLALDPDDATAHYNLGVSLEALDREPEAEAHYRRAVSLRPGFAEAHARLAALLARRGEDAAAAGQYAEALAREPRLTVAARDYAWLLATSPDASVRDGRRAIRWAEHAAAAASDDPWMLDVLAAACAEAGEFERAVRVQAEAVARAPGARRAGFEARLELYRRGRPFRAPGPAPAQAGHDPS